VSATGPANIRTPPPLTMPPEPGPQTLNRGPAQFVVETFLACLQAIPAYATMFGDAFYPWLREGLSTQELPAIMAADMSEIQGERFIDGQMQVWCVLPPAVRGALAAQMARAIKANLCMFFKYDQTMLATMPGLAWFGRRPRVDMTRAYLTTDGPSPAPIVLFDIDWGVDLKVFERWLIAQSRTPAADPFAASLVMLDEVFATVLAYTEADEPSGPLPGEAIPPDDVVQISSDGQVEVTPQPSPYAIGPLPPADYQTTMQKTEPNKIP